MKARSFAFIVPLLLTLATGWSHADTAALPKDAAHLPGRLHPHAVRPSPPPADFAPSPEVECFGNFHTMGVIANVPGGVKPGDVQAMKCFLNVAGKWEPVPDLVQVGKFHWFAGSIFWLMPGSQYQVKVVVEHPPGTVLKTWFGQGSTRAEPAVHATERALFVAPGGNDAATGDRDHPLKTVAAALAKARPGTTVLLRGGVYHEGDLAFPSGGDAARPIVLRSAPAERAVLDGSNPGLADPKVWKHEADGLYSHALEGMCYNVVLEEKDTGKLIRLLPIFTAAELRTRKAAPRGGFKGCPFEQQGIKAAFCADGKTIRLLPPAPLENYVVRVARATKGLVIESKNHITIAGLEIRFFGKNDYSCAAFVRDSSDICFDHCRFVLDDTGVWLKGKSSRVTVQNCTFLDDLDQWPFALVKSGGNPASFESGAVYVDSKFSGRGLVVRDNHIEKLFDGAHLCPWTQDDARTNETDFYGNTVLNTLDDFLETDGFSRNVRIFDNYLRRSLTGVSLAQALDGPTYVAYNVIADCGLSSAAVRGGDWGYPIKLNGGSGAEIGSGPIYLYHNTAYTADPQSYAMVIKRPTWRKITLRNNLWYGKKLGFAIWKSPPSPLDFDYDNVFVADGKAPLFVLAYKKQYRNLDEVREKLKWLPHGMSADPHIADEKAGLYSLRPGSPCIDAGVVVPGINTWRIRGKGPDLGALETP